jgi:pimeloyl-ACP methyl ester carboxylesterase
MRRFIIIAVLAVLAVLTAGMAFLWTPDTDRDEMVALYGGEKARWAPVTGHEGYRVHYQVSGPEDAPVLVLIHGTSASLHTWEPLRERLEEDYRIIAYDQPGHGLTGPHPERDYSYEGMAVGLDAVFAAEGIEEAVLIGNSMGGWVAWRDALANPDRVRALVLLDASGIPGTRNPEAVEGFRRMQSPVLRFLMRFVTPRSRIEESVRQTVAVQDIVTEEMIDRYWHLVRFPGNRQALGDQFVPERADLSGRLGEGGAPTLVIWGEEDSLVLPSGAEGFAARMPDARAVLYEGVGHLPMEEAPDGTASDIRTFLEEALSPEPGLAERLEGSWRLTHLDGEPPLAPSEGRDAGVSFTSNRLSASAGCNRGSGSILSFSEGGYALDGQLATTKMFCAELMEEEAAFFAIVSHGAVRFEGETLVMVGPNGREARFDWG